MLPQNSTLNSWGTLGGTSQSDVTQNGGHVPSSIFPVGRPRKTWDKYKAIAIRLHPKVLVWAKREAKRCGVGLPDSDQ